MGLFDFWKSPVTSQPSKGQAGSLVPYRLRRARGVLGWLRDRVGPWLGPKASTPTRVADYLRDERTRSGPAGVVFPWFLPYHDPGTTNESPEMRHAYRQMLASPHCRPALMNLILGCAALELRVKPASKSARDVEIANFVKWNLTRRLKDAVHGLIWSVCSGGLVDGYSVCECVWDAQQTGRWAGKWVLRAVKPKNVDYDLVLQTDEWRNVVGILGLRYNGGEEFDPSDYLIYRHQPFYDNPTGQSALRAAYASWWMLDTLRKLRAVACERRASPILWGTWKDQSQQAKLQQALEDAKMQSWLATPEEVRVQALDIAGQGESIFKSFYNDLVHECFLSIQGSYLANLEGSTQDGRGDTKIHENTNDLFRDDLAARVQALLNDEEAGLVKNMVDLNYTAADYPLCMFSAVSTDDLLKEAQLDATLVGQIGLELSKEEAYERYNRSPPKGPDDTLGGDQGGGQGGPGGPEGGNPFAALMGGGGGGPEGEPGQDQQDQDQQQQPEPAPEPRGGGGKGRAPLAQPLQQGPPEQPQQKQQPQRFAEDRQGGELPKVALPLLRAADFITLPPADQGTNCGNCQFARQQGQGLVCGHKKLRGQPVTARNCCAYWNSPDALRTWKGGPAQARPFAESDPAGKDSDPIQAEPGSRDGSLLNLPDVRQHDHFSCGACATAAVGRWFGVGPRTLAGWKKALGTSIERSTSPQAIIRYLRSLGLNVEARQGLTIADLDAATKAGKPVICPVQDYGPVEKADRQAGAQFDYGHYLAVVGVAGGHVVCQDSSAENVLKQNADTIAQPGRVLIRAQDWLRNWHDQDVRGRKYVRFGIIVGPGPGPQQGPRRFAEWNEQEHPRGQPGNKGEFAKKKGGGGGGTAVKDDKPKSKEKKPDQESLSRAKEIAAINKHLGGQYTPDSERDPSTPRSWYGAHDKEESDWINERLAALSQDAIRHGLDPGRFASEIHHLYHLQMARKAASPEAYGHATAPGIFMHAMHETGLAMMREKRARDAEVFRQLKAEQMVKDVPPPPSFGGSQAQIKVVSRRSPEQVQKFASRLLGRDVPLQSLADLVGAPDNAVVSVTPGRTKDYLTIRVNHPDYQARRTLGVDGDGKTFIHNDEFFMKEHAQGKGLGMQVFGKQVENAQKLGVAYIETHAAGYKGSTMNGYYTWPRFGYDYPIWRVMDWRGLQTRLREKFPEAETIQDVMLTPEGQAWWKENGSDLFQATFDLTPGSRSLKVFHAYLNERAQRPPKPDVAKHAETVLPVDADAGGLGVEEADVSAADEAALDRAWEKLRQNKD